MFDAELMVSKSGFDIVRVCLQKTGKHHKKQTKYNVTFEYQHSHFCKLTHRVSAVQLLQQSEVSSFGESTLLIH